MVEPVSHNAILASMFGTAPARTVFGAGALAAGQPGSIDETSTPEAYPQPTDSAEFSTDILRAAPATNETKTTDSVDASPGTSTLSEEEQAEVVELKQRDREVRRHEQAHKAAAGSIATGGPSFEYQTGPDGKRYAVGGEVNIDTSEVPGDPQATVSKMQQIRRAAAAPANPSSQDRAVASRAAAAERAARAELAEQKRADSPGETAASSSTATGALVDLIA